MKKPGHLKEWPPFLAENIQDDVQFGIPTDESDAFDGQLASGIGKKLIKRTSGQQDQQKSDGHLHPHPITNAMVIPPMKIQPTCCLLCRSGEQQLQDFRLAVLQKNE